MSGNPERRIGGDSTPWPTRSETPGAQTLRRGLAVLTLLTRVGPGGLRMGEIGRRLGLSKATAVRLTRTLVDEKFVAHDPGTRTYRLGPESFAVGLAAEPSYALQRRAAPQLRRLALESGDWVFFSVLHGYEAICLSRETGTVAIPREALKAGDRVPLGVGAAGVAILAALPDVEIDAALQANAAAIAQDFPGCTAPIIRELVAQTRREGCSTIAGLIVPNYGALGVALVNAQGRPEAAISLVAPMSRLHASRRSTLGERMIFVARELMESPAPAGGVLS